MKNCYGMTWHGGLDGVSLESSEKLTGAEMGRFVRLGCRCLRCLLSRSGARFVKAPKGGVPVWRAPGFKTITKVSWRVLIIPAAWKRRRRRRLGTRIWSGQTMLAHGHQTSGRVWYPSFEKLVISSCHVIRGSIPDPSSSLVT